MPVHKLQLKVMHAESFQKITFQYFVRITKRLQPHRKRRASLALQAQAPEPKWSVQAAEHGEESSLLCVLQMAPLLCGIGKDAIGIVVAHLAAE